MRIGMQTWGSHGDIRSLLALAGGLQARGHEVTLAVTSTDGTDYSPTAAALGVRLVDVASQKIALAEKDPETSRAIADEPDIIKQMQLIITRLLLPAEAEMYAAAEALSVTRCKPRQRKRNAPIAPSRSILVSFPARGRLPPVCPTWGKPPTGPCGGWRKAKSMKPWGPPSTV
jgi:hypothetical protein